MFVTNWISTTKIQKISEITNFFRHYFLSRTEVLIYVSFIIWVQRYSFSVIKDYSHLITICSKFPKITGYGSVSASSAYRLSAMRFSRTFFRLSAEPIPNFFLMLARWVVMFDSDLLSSVQISLNFLFCRIR